MTRRSRRSVLATLATGVAGGLAGCDQSGGDNGPTPAESPTPDGASTATLTPTATTTSTAPQTPTAVPAPDLDDPERSGSLIAEGGTSNDGFGAPVAAMGDRVLVGAALDDTRHGEYAGSVYVFEDDGGWRQATNLRPDDGADRDRFGAAVSVSGSRALIGANGADTDNGPQSGAAYVFERTEGSWTQETVLVPDDGDRKEAFGSSVALSSDTAVIGTRDPGEGDPVGTRSVYVFERADGRWRHRTELRSGHPAETERFAAAVACGRETVFVGATYDDTTDGYESGAVYAFDDRTGSWKQHEILGKDDATWHAHVGAALDLAGDRLLVGAPGEPKNRKVGAAYVFDRVGDSWRRRARLAAPDGDDEDRFGDAVALADDTALVGASGAGRTYHYERTNTGWQHRTTLAPDDGARSWFGSDVAFGPDFTVVGAPADRNRNGHKGGAVVVYS